MAKQYVFSTNYIPDIYDDKNKKISCLDSERVKTYTFEKSTVGNKSKGDINDTKFRNSLVSNNNFSIDFDKSSVRSNEHNYSTEDYLKYEEKMYELVKKIIPTNECIKISFENGKLLMYEKDCFFAKHKDQSKNKNHIGTLLIYPPCEYQGGKLIINENEIKIDKKKWCMVIIATDISHEVN